MYYAQSFKSNNAQYFQSWAEHKDYSELSRAATIHEDFSSALGHYKKAVDILLSSEKVNDLAVYEIEANIQEIKLFSNAEDALIEKAVGFCMACAQSSTEMYGNDNGLPHEILAVKIMVNSTSSHYIKQGLMSLGRLHPLVRRICGKDHHFTQSLNKLLLEKWFK
jgi:hypothetical protein